MINLTKNFLLKIICTTTLLFIFSPYHAEGSQKRIFHGQNARQSDFQYHVSIQQNGEHSCGGAIITDQFILTAAHCFVSNGKMTASKSHITVKSGTNSLLPGSGFENEVEKIMVLLEYVNNSHEGNMNNNDIAVVKLIDKLILDGYFQNVINLPEEYVTTPSAGETVTIAGYGLTEEANIYIDDNKKLVVIGDYSEILQTIQPVVMDSKACRMTEKHICTIVPRDDNDKKLYGECYGDSGSPLVYNKTVVGIVSGGGPLCGKRNSRTIYTRVSFYLEFIYDALNELNNHEMVTYKMSQKNGYYYRELE